MKTNAFILVCSFAFAILSSSGTSINTEHTDPVTGTYYLHGNKTITIYPCTFTCFDMEPHVGVESIASVVNIRRVEEKADSLLFYGLPGADEGKRGIYFGIHRSFYDNVFSIQLHDRESYKVYANLAGNTFEIDLNNAGNIYQATGIFENGTIELKGRYHYRQRTFEFDLKGIKIEL